MRFDIDYARAKDMATRLQDFMSASPKKLSRSSAIEAVARTLGFNNRNEMAARIDAEEAPHESNPRQSPQDAAYAALDALLAERIEKAARDLVDAGRKILPRATFRDAMHEEDPEEGLHPLMIVEDRILQDLLADPRLRAVLTGALVDNWEYDGARSEGLDGPEAVARAIVNEAMEKAEAIWDEEQSAEDNPLVAIYEAAVDGIVQDLCSDNRSDAEIRGQLEAAAGKLGGMFKEPAGRVIADIRKGMIARQGYVPGDPAPDESADP